jgi:heme/copper-type cytochrome/quinol oxidase subunit 1
VNVTVPRLSRNSKRVTPLMNTLLIIVAVIAVILLVTGGLVQSLNFLLWVGVVLLIIAVISYLVRSMSGRRS